MRFILTAIIAIPVIFARLLIPADGMDCWTNMHAPSDMSSEERSCRCQHQLDADVDRAWAVCAAIAAATEGWRKVDAKKLSPYGDVQSNGHCPPGQSLTATPPYGRGAPVCMPDRINDAKARSR